MGMSWGLVAVNEEEGEVMRLRMPSLLILPQEERQRSQTFSQSSYIG